MVRDVDAADVAELSAYDAIHGLPDRWLETLTVAAVSIANGLGAKIKLPPDQRFKLKPKQDKRAILAAMRASAARLNPKKYGHLAKK